ncbi:hypothetical protein MPSEU_000279100 [Mayamaea pseudoterrestris]|nr:hypothetical protein MPSEU_000279100 [Mayamaea pseudoterrestris]
MGCFHSLASTTALFSFLKYSHGLASNEFALFDRFRAECPAPPSCLHSFDPSLTHHANDASHEDHIWCAVYRSCNNAPSVMVRDEFLHAMRSATNTVNPTALPVESMSSFEPQLAPLQNQQSPVAIARIKPSQDFPGSWVLDTMRCVLRKETQDSTCDGGSEHTEAISVAIDALLEYHLSKHSEDERIEKFAIRTKATLVSSKVLEDRGFVEVDRLERDMATHVSNVDACLERYAERSVTTSAKSSGARQRALKIVSLLGRLEQTKAQQQAETYGDETDSDDYDPWASFRQLNS